jgi:release factor glutamine methyltransferase
MKIPSNKIQDLITFFRAELKGLYTESEINILMDYCFEVFSGIRFSQAKVSQATISESQLLKFNFAIKDLKKHVPVQYVVGKAHFYGSVFNVRPSVLIPRPETEELVDLIIKENKGITDLSIIDIGTGSGCIAVSLKKNLQDAKVSALDISAAALEVATENAMLNNVEIEFIQRDILNEDLSNGQKFDVIVSNPPYVCRSEHSEMEKNVLDYEPHLALFVEDDDPLLFYRAITESAVRHGRAGARIYFEINQAFGQETADLMKEKGFENIELLKDINNKNRILRGNLP